jgi:hypothetical protein
MMGANVTALVREPLMKKGRHRRFEEARKLKQAGPSAFDLGFGGGNATKEASEDDEYARLAEKYGVSFDEDDDENDDD